MSPDDHQPPGAWAVHGFSDDETTRRLLRSKPPETALAWAGAALGGTVVSATALRGGMSSAVHLLEVDLPGGATKNVVLRRYVRAELTAEEPDIAEREARILRLIAGIGVPTPVFVDVDPDGSKAGAPALLMSHVPGRVDWWPTDVERWLGRLSELLPEIHATALPPDEGTPALPVFSPYRQSSYVAPEWARWPGVWERAFEIFHGPSPELERTFIHRDFHPGNVLWRRGSVTGVVDWQSACVGPPSIDVGHCRTNLFRYGLEVADRFTALWERLTGRGYDPWTEVVSIVGVLDDQLRRPRPDRVPVEDALARAVAELG
jgi:aminoglycoside phosphotransferase (APT) family kinase protein